MRRSCSGVLACLFLALFFCAPVLGVEAKEKDTVNIYAKPTIGPVVIAIGEGYFEEQGIQVEFVKANNSSETWLLLAGGSVDAVVGTPASGLYNAVSFGKDIKLVASTVCLTAGNKSETFGIRKGAEKKADTKRLVRGLKGKKIGIAQLGSLSNYLVDRLLSDNGVSEKDVELVIVPHHSMAQSLQTGVLDAGILTEPFGSVLRNKSGEEIAFVSFGDVFPDTPFIYLIFGEKLLAKDPELGVRFMKAFLKGCQRYKEGKTQRNIEIIAKHTGLDEETVRTVNWSTVDPDGIFKSAGILDAYQEWLLKKRYIEKEVPVESLVDTSLLELAKKELS